MQTMDLVAMPTSGHANAIVAHVLAARKGLPPARPLPYWQNAFAPGVQLPKPVATMLVITRQT